MSTTKSNFTFGFRFWLGLLLLYVDDILLTTIIHVIRVFALLIFGAIFRPLKTNRKIVIFAVCAFVEDLADEVDSNVSKVKRVLIKVECNIVLYYTCYGVCVDRREAALLGSVIVAADTFSETIPWFSRRQGHSLGIVSRESSSQFVLQSSTSIT